MSGKKNISVGSFHASFHNVSYICQMTLKAINAVLRQPQNYLQAGQNFISFRHGFP